MDKHHAEISYHHEGFGTYVGTREELQKFKQILIDASLYNIRRAEEYKHEGEYNLEAVCRLDCDYIMDIWDALFHLEREEK